MIKHPARIRLSKTGDQLIGIGKFEAFPSSNKKNPYRHDPILSLVQMNKQVKHGAVIPQQRPAYSVWIYFVPTVSLNERKQTLHRLGYSRGCCDRIARWSIRRDAQVALNSNGYKARYDLG